MKYIEFVSKLPIYALNTLLVIACLFLAYFSFNFINGVDASYKNKAEKTEKKSTFLSSSTPNLVTSGFAKASSVVEDDISEIGEKLRITGKYTVDKSADLVINTGSGAVGVSKNVASLVINTNVKVYSFLIGKPIEVANSLIYEPVLAKHVSPSNNLESVQIIDPNSPDIEKAMTQLTEARNSQSASQTEANSNAPIIRWPLTGRITTKFGVPHWPYQKYHTGIDITDGSASGATPIYPFRSGVVVKVQKSNSGLGNHVIVDHQNGVTSVYAHLDSIGTFEGQNVTTDTVIGRQGTTGVSTGVHLHFEVRINGRATDPLPFLQA